MINNDEQYTRNGRACRWIYYTAGPSIFTYILACAYDLILGYKITQSLSNHFLEFILMVFAISFGIYGAVSNVERNIKGKVKEIYGNISLVCCFACLAFYGFLYYWSNMESFDNKSAGIDSKATIVVRIFFVILAIIIIVAGFYFEWNAEEAFSCNAPNKDKNKKRGDKCE